MSEEKQGTTTVPTAQSVQAVQAIQAPETPQTDRATTETTGYRRLFAVREFRAVFLAHALSLLGVVISEIALTVLVYGLTGSPLLSALAFALGFLPYLVGGTLLAGVADRFPARRVLVGCDLVCAGCAALMALPSTPVAALLALRCVIAAVAPVFNGTRMATLTEILGDGDQFVLGRSLLRIVSQSAVLVGFGLGGVLLTFVSPRGALVITLGTFLASALLLRCGTRRRPARAGGGSLVRYSLSGTREVLGDRRIRALLLLLWAPPMFVVAPEALAAAYADELGVGAAEVGLLMCAMPVGTIAGELYAGAALSPAARSRIVLPLACGTLLPLLAFPFHPGLGWILPMLLLAGSAGAYTLGLDRWFVDAVPEELRGRAMTVHTAGLMTIQGVGMALAGVAAEFWAVSTVVGGVGALGTLCCVLLALEVRRTGGERGEGAWRGGTETRDGADHDMTGR
ncbi:MFS transporter [Streptomyces montanus]|uniref:MFS transporter n=1 Tax=Streptomyces montanus TaxID=2580423 RepID=A0A5R9FB54_9ACTN|nr:MFS transporter [Streptomyces montanus]TLS41002.1 MFS transporter [Streptomyces montanus]